MKRTKVIGKANNDIKSSTTENRNGTRGAGYKKKKKRETFVESLEQSKIVLPYVVRNLPLRLNLERQMEDCILSQLVNVKMGARRKWMWWSVVPANARKDLNALFLNNMVCTIILSLWKLNLDYLFWNSIHNHNVIQYLTQGSSEIQRCSTFHRRLLLKFWQQTHTCCQQSGCLLGFSSGCFPCTPSGQIHLFLWT